MQLRILIIVISFFFSVPTIAVELWMKVDSNGKKTNSISNGGAWATPTTVRFYQMDPGFNDSTPISGSRRLYTPDIDKVVFLTGDITGYVLELKIRLAHVYLKVSNNATNSLPWDTSQAKCYRREVNELHTESPINLDPWDPPHYCSSGKLTPADAYDRWNVNQILFSVNPVANDASTGWESYLDAAMKSSPKDNYRGELYFPICQEVQGNASLCNQLYVKVNLEVAVSLTSAQLSQDEVKFNITRDPVTQKVSGVASVYAMLSGQFGRALTVEVKSGTTQGKLTNSQSQSEIPYTMDATLVKTGIKERILDGRSGLRKQAVFNWINGNTAQVQFDFAFEQDADITPAGTYTDNMVIMFSSEV